MKANNRRKKLQARIDSWEAIRATDGNEKKKKVGKSEFTKPGSYKK